MRRRELVAGLAGASVWPLAVRAQQQPIPVTGFLSSESPETFRELVPAFSRGLAEAGYSDGRNVIIEYRWAESHNERLSALVGDLVRRQVTVIVTPGSNRAPACRSSSRARGCKQCRTTCPCNRGRPVTGTGFPGPGPRLLRFLRHRSFLESQCRKRSALTARLDEEAFAFWGDRDRRDHVVGAKAAFQFPMQFPEMAAAFAYLFKASGNQVAPDAPATQSLFRAISNVHYRFSFAAELVESKSRTLAALALAAGLGRPA